MGAVLGLGLALKFLWSQCLGDDERDAEKLQANILREKQAAQMAKLLQLFERSRGRPPHDEAEFAEWYLSPGGSAAVPLHLDKSGEIIP